MDANYLESPTSVAKDDESAPSPPQQDQVSNQEEDSTPEPCDLCLIGKDVMDSAQLANLELHFFDDSESNAAQGKGGKEEAVPTAQSKAEPVGSSEAAVEVDDGPEDGKDEPELDEIQKLEHTGTKSRPTPYLQSHPT